MLKYLFVGGDLRLLYAAEKLHKSLNLQDGETAVYGFDDADARALAQSLSLTVLDKPKQTENVVLPLPAVVGNAVNAPYATAEIPLALIPAICEESVFCGKADNALIEICGELSVCDYFAREELTVKNAALTAEAALEIIIRESALSVCGMKVLIAGYGRISKILFKYLSALGADITVYARKCSDRAWVQATGGSVVCSLDNLSRYDTIVNTVPATLFTRERLQNVEKNTLILDLASKDKDGNGGVDINYAAGAGVKAIWALSLPGKCSPVSAGEIIADTLYNIVTEREIC